MEDTNPLQSQKPKKQNEQNKKHTTVTNFLEISASVLISLYAGWL